MKLLFGLIAYLLGSIPFGLLISRLKGIDIRQHGSKNIGATNVFRVVGKKWGITVFLLDALKGYLAVSLPEFFSPGSGLTFSLFLAMLAILGHTFPIWLKFKGGKGVATSLGVFLAALPVPALITFAFWILFFLIFRIISVASLAAAVFFPAAIWIFLDHHLSGFRIAIIISFLLMGFIFYTHRANIQRLRKGEEKKLF